MTTKHFRITTSAPCTCGKKTPTCMDARQGHYIYADSVQAAVTAVRRRLNLMDGVPLDVQAWDHRAQRFVLELP